MAILSSPACWHWPKRPVPTTANSLRRPKLQAFVQSQRPAWSRAYLLKGLLLDFRGNVDQAADAYREAIRLGERQPLVFQRLILRLLQTNQTEEADRYLAIMQDRVSTSAQVSLHGDRVAAGRGQIDRALESARRGVEQNPRVHRRNSGWGSCWPPPRRPTEAEAALKKALALAPDDQRTLEVLFDFYLKTNRTAEARELLGKVAKKEKLAKAQRALFLAKGYEKLARQESGRCQLP